MALKATWVVRILSKNGEQYKFIYSELPIQNEMIWQCNMNTRDFRNTGNFAEQIWKAWSKANDLDPQNTSDVLDQIIWYNSRIKRALKH